MEALSGGEAAQAREGRCLAPSSAPGPAARPACPAPPRAAEGPGHRPRRSALIEPDPEAHVEGGGPDPGRRTLGERAGEVMLRAFGELRFSFPLD